MAILHFLIQRYGRAAWQQRWYAIAVAWAVCGLGWLGVMSIPNQYEANARLYVDSDAVLTPLLRGLAIDSSGLSPLDVLQRTLLSRPNLEKLISKTDFELSITGPADLERRVEELGRDIKVVAQTRNIFSITYRNTDPKLAYSVVQTILSIFVESRVGNDRTDMQTAQTFLDQQIRSYEMQLQDAEKKRAEFRARYVDLLPGTDGGQSRLEIARATVRTLEGQVIDAQAKRTMLDKELSGIPPTLSRNGAGGIGGGGDPALAAAERKLDVLRTTFTDKNPDVIAARNEVAALRANPHAGGGSRPDVAGPADRPTANPVYDQLKLNLVDTDAQVNSLQRQLTDSRKERDRLEEIARNAPGLQAEYLNINRDYDVVRKNYEELLSRREAMRISRAADAETSRGKMQIVDPPQVPHNPIGPKRLLMLSGVLMGGLGCGVGVLFLLARLDQSYATRDDLARFGLPVIGSISLVGSQTPRGLRIAAVGATSVAVLLLLVVYAGLAVRLLRSTQII